MSESWKKLNLEGGGLQSANLKLAALLKRRRRAYGLLLLFPLGLHRDYLEHRAGAWTYRLLSAAALAAWGLGFSVPALAFAGVLAVFALYDLRWIENRVARLNKGLRMEVYMHQSAGAPEGFRGRFTDEDTLETYLREKDRETPDQAPAPGAAPADPTRRVPSIAEQEKLLRELAKSRKKQ
ncbi:MAG: TM2 domain-containing protein [Betaproteobacteria bacterium]|nr:TM2 domain-containing protein [Betaproteobacteria bacterium]